MTFEELLKECKIYPKVITKTGGQTVGITRIPMILEHEDLQIKLECGYHRSQHQNIQELTSMLEWFYTNNKRLH